MNVAGVTIPIPFDGKLSNTTFTVNYMQLNAADIVVGDIVTYTYMQLLLYLFVRKVNGSKFVSIQCQKCSSVICLLSGR